MLHWEKCYIGENVTGENVTGEFVTGENVLGENVIHPRFTFKSTIFANSKNAKNLQISK